MTNKQKALLMAIAKYYVQNSLTQKEAVKRMITFGYTYGTARNYYKAALKMYGGEAK